MQLANYIMRGMGIGKPKADDERQDQRDGTFGQYVDTIDAAQNAVDLMTGWNGALPPEANATAGAGALYADGRIDWAIRMSGGLAGADVLEIGPMEASHTYMLEKAGAKVHAIEANKLGFLKCLIVKEVLGLSARFSLAEANLWLETKDESHDLIVACGVLYHMRDPFHFIELLARRANSIYLWTHYVHADQIKILKGVSTYHPIPVERLGETFMTYPRPYEGAWEKSAFCGGIADEAKWLRFDDILRAFILLGFADITIEHHNSDDIHAPSFSLFARRQPAV